MKNLKLANTLRRIAENGGGEFYNGSVAKDIAEEMKNIGSIITEDDLKAYQPEWSKPVISSVQNKFEVVGVPPPGSGANVAYMLNILAVSCGNFSILTWHISIFLQISTGIQFN